MAGYSVKRKASVRKKLLPPHNRPVSEAASDEGISEATLYNRYIEVREQRLPVPGGNQTLARYYARARFPLVVETVTISQSEYCREKGLYPKQVQQWKQVFMNGSSSERKQEQKEVKAERRQIKVIMCDLRRKEKPWSKPRSCWCCEKAQGPSRGDRRQGRRASLP